MPDDVRIRVPLSLAEVAAALNTPLHRLHRKIRKMRDMEGFPHPLPGIGGYDPLAIVAWQNRMLGIAPTSPADADPQEDEVAAARKRMADRAKSMGDRAKRGAAA